MNTTLEKFGFPNTLIKQYSRWALLLRPQQVTLGSLVLVCLEEAKAFSAVSTESFVELSLVIREVETNLSVAFSYERINYLMLMMVDPDVHFHIIPRYGSPQAFLTQQFFDHGWPGPPNLKLPNETSQETNLELQGFLKTQWKSLD
ncbi:MAG: HIT family protein [Nitrospirales bacterium]